MIRSVIFVVVISSCIYIYIYIDDHQQEVDTFDSVLLLLLIGRFKFSFVFKNYWSLFGLKF